MLRMIFRRHDVTFYESYSIILQHKTKLTNMMGRSLFAFTNTGRTIFYIRWMTLKVLEREGMNIVGSII